jgi:hypothetical protein
VTSDCSPPLPDVERWFTEHLPAHWGAGEADIVGDTEELLVVLDLGSAPAGADARITRFREDTRDERMVLADEAERVFGRKVSWGARAGGTTVVFTVASVPVMTRLRLPERRVLDTLIDAGVARSRSEALAWCVRLVGENEAQWMADLRDAFSAVERVRQVGPRSRRDGA